MVHRAIHVLGGCSMTERRGDGRAARDRLLVWVLLLVAAVAIADLVVVFLLSESGDRSSLRTELGKAAIQLLVVVVIGTVLKLVVDRHQARAQRAEQDQRFRQEKYDLVVGVTNTLRRVPLLVEANRSVKTWSEEMLGVMDAGLRLRSLKHQIFSCRVLDSPPFASHAALSRLLEEMYRYTDWVLDDFTANKKRLSELQRVAEAAEPEERGAAQERIWRELCALASIADMGVELTGDARASRRAEIVEWLSAGADAGPFVARGDHPTWATYLECESVALELMTQARWVEPEIPRLSEEPTGAA